MRLRACLAILLLTTGACAHIPSLIRLEVDGSTVEIKKKPESPDRDQRGEDSTETPQDDGRG